MSADCVVLAITGASGVAYAVRLLEVLLDAGRDVHLSISPSGQKVLRHELDRVIDLERFSLSALLPEREASLARREAAPSDQAAIGRAIYHHFEDMLAPIASGSFLTAGMVVCPCSGSTLGGIVHGSGDNLIHRAAAVHLKERRRLVLVPRETPLSIIQLDNMRRACEAGAVMLPAMPGFYHGATTIADLVDFVVARICDQLGVEHQLMRRWGS